MIMVYIAPPYVWVIAFVIVAYLDIVIYFWSYLKRAHHDTWLKLGSPSFLNNSILNGFRSAKFILGGGYKSLSDPKVTGLVWTIRGVATLCFTLVIFGNIFGLLPAR